MKSFIISVKLTIVFCVLLFVSYLSVLWIVATLATPNSGQAEIAMSKSKVVGAKQVGQSFTSNHYFWSRPSAVDYDGGISGGSNYGPGNPEYLALLEERIAYFLSAHPYLKRSEVPAEMITAGGSGLDPDISPKGAEVQIRRVAEARGLSLDQVAGIVKAHTKNPLIGPLTVNVLNLNIALDEMK